MRKLATALLITALGLSLHAASAGEAPRNDAAARPAAPPNAQQQKMATCNTEASQQNLKGDARQNFMRQCLSAKPATANRQQDRMKQCNAAADTQKQKNE